MNKLLLLSSATLAAATMTTPASAKSAKTAERPNVIIVLVDDLGSTDVSFNGCTDIITPNIDRIANEGVNCTDAYISAPYSGPSRCGLMTGRYQQRFGVDGNIEASPEGRKKSIAEKLGVLESEVMLSELLKEYDYNTCAIGKWHLGDHYDLLPNQQGFDYWYGFSGGGHSYWGERAKSGAAIQENGKEVFPTEQTYITDDFTQKAVDFIDNNAKKENPFFIYLAYNAPHGPLQASKKYLDRTKHIYHPERSVYAAMVLSVDDGMGRVWEALERTGADDNTIVIFLSDNGGASMTISHNTPRRAYKGNMFDGGIRTPFAIWWKGRLKPGKIYDKTISSLDIYATVAAQAGADISKCKNPLDGTDLIPYLRGKNRANPHDALYWRVCGGMEYAMRKGDYKLVKTWYQDEHMLFDIANDEIEQFDIAAQHPGVVKEMLAEYNKWDAEMMDPRWEDLHAKHQVLDFNKWENYRKKASGNR